MSRQLHGPVLELPTRDRRTCPSLLLPAISASPHRAVFGFLVTLLGFLELHFGYGMAPIYVKLNRVHHALHDQLVDAPARRTVRLHR